jgi:hypothetical protein
MTNLHDRHSSQCSHHQTRFLLSKSLSCLGRRSDQTLRRTRPGAGVCEGDIALYRATGQRNPARTVDVPTIQPGPSELQSQNRARSSLALVQETCRPAPTNGRGANCGFTKTRTASCAKYSSEQTPCVDLRACGDQGFSPSIV